MVLLAWDPRAICAGHRCGTVRAGGRNTEGGTRKDGVAGSGSTPFVGGGGASKVQTLLLA